MYSYFSIQEKSEYIYKDKGSKFYGYAFPCSDISDIDQNLLHIKQLHPKATHHCYAYRLGMDRNIFRTNDDGEPGNTAGKPILGQIDALGITNILVIVVRYFGGTKLGVGGLIDAYKRTAMHTLAEASIIEKILLDTLKLTTHYDRQQDIYKIIRQYEGNILETATDGYNISVLVTLPSQYNIHLNSFQENYPYLRLDIIKTLG